MLHILLLTVQDRVFLWRLAMYICRNIKNCVLFSYGDFNRDIRTNAGD